MGCVESCTLDTCTSYDNKYLTSGRGAGDESTSCYPSTSPNSPNHRVTTAKDRECSVLVLEQSSRSHALNMSLNSATHRLPTVLSSSRMGNHGGNDERVQDGYWRLTQLFLSNGAPSFFRPQLANAQPQVPSRLRLSNIAMWDKQWAVLRNPTTTAVGYNKLQLSLTEEPKATWPCVTIHHVELERKGNKQIVRTRATVTTCHSAAMPSAPLRLDNIIHSSSQSKGAGGTWLLHTPTAIALLREAVERYPVMTNSQGEMSQRKKLQLLSDPTSHLKSAYGRVTITFSQPESSSAFCFPVTHLSSSMGPEQAAALLLRVNSPVAPRTPTRQPLEAVQADQTDRVVDLFLKDTGASEEKLHRRMLSFARTKQKSLSKSMEEQSSPEQVHKKSQARNTTENHPSKHSSGAKKSKKSKKNPNNSDSLIEMADIDDYQYTEGGEALGGGYTCKEPTASEAARRLLRRSITAKLNLEDEEEDMELSFHNTRRTKGHLNASSTSIKQQERDTECLRYANQRAMPHDITISVDCDPDDNTAAAVEAEKTCKPLQAFSFPSVGQDVASTRLSRAQLWATCSEDSASGAATPSNVTPRRRRDSNGSQTAVSWGPQLLGLGGKNAELDFSNCSTPTFPGFRRRSDPSQLPLLPGANVPQHFVLVGSSARHEVLYSSQFGTDIVNAHSSAAADVVALQIAHQTVASLERSSQHEHSLLQQERCEEEVHQDHDTLLLSWYEALCFQNTTCPVEGIALSSIQSPAAAMSMLTGFARVRGEPTLYTAMTAFQSTMAKDRRNSNSGTAPNNAVSSFQDYLDEDGEAMQHSSQQQQQQDPLLQLVCNDTERWDDSSASSTTYRPFLSNSVSFDDPPVMTTNQMFLPLDPMFCAFTESLPKVPSPAANLPGQVAEDFDVTSASSRAVPLSFSQQQQQLPGNGSCTGIPHVFLPPQPLPSFSTPTAPPGTQQQPSRRVRRGSLVSNFTSFSDVSDTVGNSFHSNVPPEGTGTVTMPTVLLAPLPTELAGSASSWRKRRQASCRRLLDRLQLINALQEGCVFEWVISQARCNVDPVPLDNPPL